MAKVRTSPLHESSIQATRILHDLGRELRLARISAGLSQAEVARQLSTSQARISRVERARDAGATLVELMRHAAAVGLRMWVRAYPAGRRLLDEPQLRLLQRFRDRISSAFRWEQEVPVPIPGDLRAADARITIGEMAILVEAITRLADFQAQARAAQLKRRDLGATRLILLVAATETNRRALRAAGPVAWEAFPVRTAATIRALAKGREPGSDCIVVL